jgi:hypothetical protein
MKRKMGVHENWKEKYKKNRGKTLRNEDKEKQCYTHIKAHKFILNILMHSILNQQTKFIGTAKQGTMLFPR